MDTQLKTLRLSLACFAVATLCGQAWAELPAKTSGAVAETHRETTVGIGYGALAPLRLPVGYDAANVPLSSATFAGYSLEVTRRFLPQLECGVVGWLSGSSSNGQGSYAHGLSRFAGEIRFVPWGMTRVEPWIGAELGLVLADDFANWDATAKTGPHAVSATRLGHLEALNVGARLRLSDLIAVGARGGLLLVGFSKAKVAHEEGDDTGTYVVHPTDYRTKPWYSVMLSAEITVTD